MISNDYKDTVFNPTKGELNLLGWQAPMAFDLDSVVLDNNFLIPLIEEHFGVDDVHPLTNGIMMFNFVIPNVEHNEVRKQVNRIIKENTHLAEPTPWASETLEYLFKMSGDKIIIVTARAEESMKATYEWLDKWLTVPFRLIMVNGMQKEVVLKRLNNTMFVDDRYKTVKRLEDYIPAPVLYRRPWNQGRPTEAGIFSIEDLRDLIPIWNAVHHRSPMDWPLNIPIPKRYIPYA